MLRYGYLVTSRVDPGRMPGSGRDNCSCVISS